MYYVGAVLVLGLNLSPDDPALSPANPNYPGGFIIMAQRAGIPVLPHIINAVMIIAALSVAIANLYVVVRPTFNGY
jgi:yeast amino acid transporter